MFKFPRFVNFFLSLLFFANFAQQSLKAEDEEEKYVYTKKSGIRVHHAKIIVCGTQGCGKTTLFDFFTSSIWSLLNPSASKECREEAIRFVSKSHTQQFNYSSGFGNYVFKSGQRTAVVSTLAFDTT